MRRYATHSVAVRRLCLLLASATHCVSCGGVKSCMQMLDQRWCDRDWKQGGMGRPPF
jgi:hypothetical protein